MSKIFDKSFNLGFVSGLILFSALNYISYLLSEEQGIHSYDRFGFGFPFFVYDYKSSISREGIDQIGLIFTILTALIISLFIGIGFKLFQIKDSREIID